MTKAADELLTSTRTTGQTVLDSDGVLKWALHNGIVRTDLSHSDWFKQGCSVAASGNAPAGEQAYLVTEDSSTGNHRISDNFTVDATVQYVVTADVKANGRDFYLMFPDVMFGTFVRWVFDLDAVSVTQEVSGTNDSATITDLGDGWYRCEMKADATTTGTNSIYLGVHNGTSTNYTGDGNSGAFVARASVRRNDYTMQNTTDGDYFTESTGSRVFHLALEHYANGNPRGLQSYEGSTNELTHSEDFTDASWTKDNTASLAIDATGPDGATSAVTLVDSNAGGTGVVSARQSVTVNTSSTYTFSVYMKQDQLSWVRLRTIGFTTPGTAAVYFDLANGVLGSTSGSGLTGTIEDRGNGWYRCAITFTTDAADTTGDLYISVADADLGGAVDLDGTSSILIFGAQFEEKDWITPYIPTSGSTVARGADNIYILTADFDFGSTAGSFVVEFDTDSGDFPNIVTINDNTNNERYFTRRDGTSVDFLVQDGGVTQADLALGTYVSGGTKTATAYAENDFSGSYNGGAVVTDTSGTLPTVDRMRLGFNLNGYIQSVYYYKSRLPDATLVTEST